MELQSQQKPTTPPLEPLPERPEMATPSLSDSISPESVVKPGAPAVPEDNTADNVPDASITPASLAQTDDGDVPADAKPETSFSSDDNQMPEQVPDLAPESAPAPVESIENKAESKPEVTPAPKIPEEDDNAPTAKDEYGNQILLPAPKPRLKKIIWCAAIALIVIAAIILAAWGAYRMGNNHGYASGTKNEQAEEATETLKVPANATIVSQCTDGEGTQYVLPQNIPNGPIYNVWQNKVTGIEYMVGQSDLLKAASNDMLLYGAKINHVDIMYEAAGHAGFTEPHYHLILSLISYADEQKIKCSGTSSSMSNMTM